MASPRLNEGRPTGRPSGQPDPFELVGHRGARGLYPENTIPAFVGALGTGVNGLELDVHVSRDGVLVVCHDPWVEVRGRRVAVMTLTARELARIDVGSRPDPEFPARTDVPAGIPTLSRVFKAVEAIGATPWWYVEVKSTLAGEGTLHPSPQEFARLVAETIELHAMEHRTIVMSFDPRPLAILGEASHPLPIHLLVGCENAGNSEAGASGDFGERQLARRVEMLGFVPRGIGPHESLVTPAVVDWAHRAGMRVVPWTVNDPSRMEALVGDGVDGFITDRPDLAARVVLDAGRR